MGPNRSPGPSLKGDPFNVCAKIYVTRIGSMGPWSPATPPGLPPPQVKDQALPAAGAQDLAILSHALPCYQCATNEQQCIGQGTDTMAHACYMLHDTTFCSPASWWSWSVHSVTLLCGLVLVLECAPRQQAYVRARPLCVSGSAFPSPSHPCIPCLSACRSARCH